MPWSTTCASSCFLSIASSHVYLLSSLASLSLPIFLSPTSQGGGVLDVQVLARIWDHQKMNLSEAWRLSELQHKCVGPFFT